MKMEKKYMMYECMTPRQGAKKWFLWTSDKPSDKPLICKTGGMIGINKKMFKELREVVNNEALDRFARD